MILAGKVRYDAIFMDHMMPGINGIQATKAIREEIDNDYAKTIPIIALTANALAGNDALYLRNGFQAFLSKPIDILRLDQVLNQWVRDREKEKELPQAPSVAGDARESEKAAEETARLIGRHSVPGLDLAAGVALFHNDMDAYTMVLRSFVKHTPTKINVLKTAGEDLESYGIAVHGLRGSGRGIGAERLGAQAKELEKAAARGDPGYISNHNPAFVEAAEKLVADIAAFLDEVSLAREAGGEGAEKPERESPDPEILRAILRACESYDMLALKRAIEDLESFRYTSCPDLTRWVTEQSHLSNFDAIQTRVISFASRNKVG